jgi:hypothetical protein
LSGEAGKSVGWWRESMAGVCYGSFELGRSKDTQGAGVAVPQMLFDSLPLGSGEFAVDVGVDFVRIEMFDR